jgi:hypothetical protein
MHRWVEGWGWFGWLTAVDFQSDNVFVVHSLSAVRDSSMDLVTGQRGACWGVQSACCM